MRAQFKCSGRICELYKKYEFTGMPGHDIITDSELGKLLDINLQIAELMKYRGDTTMCSSFLNEVHSIKRMIAARKSL